MGIENLQKKFEEVQEQRNALIQQLRDGGLKDAFAEFFENNPDVKALTWKQYIPAFNDGDACEFGLTDVLFTRDDVDPDEDEWISADEYEDDSNWIDATKTSLPVKNPNYEKEHELWKSGGEWRSDNPHPRPKYYLDENVDFPEKCLDAAEIAKFLSNAEDLLEDLFGSNAAVLVLPDRIISEEWDCGY